jgi:hypothetical protein
VSFFQLDAAQYHITQSKRNTVVSSTEIAMRSIPIDAVRRAHLYAKVAVADLRRAFAERFDDSIGNPIVEAWDRATLGQRDDFLARRYLRRCGDRITGRPPSPVQIKAAADRAEQGADRAAP